MNITIYFRMARVSMEHLHVQILHVTISAMNQLNLVTMTMALLVMMESSVMEKKFVVQAFFYFDHFKRLLDLQKFD